MGQDRAREEPSGRTPTSGAWSAEVSRALRESLEGYCTPEIGHAIVTAALARAGLDAPPETAEALSTFVTQSLSPEVEKRLGDDAAADLEQRMTVVIHVLGRASRAPALALETVDDDLEFGPEPPSEVRPVPTERPGARLDEIVTPPRAARTEAATKPPPGRGVTEDERPTSPPAPAPSAGSSSDSSGAITISSDGVRDLMVAVVSPDSKLAQRVRGALGDAGEAIGYRSLADLARAEPGALDVVLVDRRGSAPSAALVLPDSARDAQIVLWPAKREAAAALGKAAPHVACVTSYGADIAIEDVLVLVRVAASRPKRA